MDYEGFKNKKKFTYTWRIKNYSYLILDKVEYFASPTFAINELCGSEWNIRLCGGPKNQGHPDIMNCFLYRENVGTEENIKMDVRVCIIDRHGSCHFVTSYEEAVFTKNWHYKFNRYRLEHIFGDRDLFLPEDLLTIRCEMWFDIEEELKNNMCFACTSINKDKRCFTWDVQNIISAQTGEIMSLIQRLSLKELSEFRMYVSVTEESRIQVEFVVEGGRRNFFAVCNIALLDSTKRVLKSNKYDYRYGYIFGIHFEHWKIPMISLINPVDDDGSVLGSKVMFLRCEFHITDGQRINTIEYANQPLRHQIILQTNEDLEGLRDDFSVLYENKTHCDAVLQIKDKAFNVHKCIICARSPVFKAMFEREMEEKKSNKVDISDLDSDTIGRMLQFMYTGTVNDFDVETALKLYQAADKYAIIYLKNKCSAFLMCNLSLANICEVLVLADRHHDEELSKISRSFVFGNSAEIFSSDEWTSFLDCETKLAGDVMKEFLVRKM